MSKRKRFVVLTGAGINLNNSIPNPQCQFTNARVVITHEYFQENQQDFWNYTYDFMSNITKSKPNAAHKSIIKFLEKTIQIQDLEVILTSQNIDWLQHDLIRKSEILMKTPDKFSNKEATNIDSFTPHIVDLHGTLQHMHCHNEKTDHYHKLVPLPFLESMKKENRNQDENVYMPKCQICGDKMKPHIQFMDDYYNEEFYRVKTVKGFAEKADCLIVAGTDLFTSR